MPRFLVYVRPRRGKKEDEAGSVDADSYGDALPKARELDKVKDAIRGGGTIARIVKASDAAGARRSQMEPD